MSDETNLSGLGGASQPADAAADAPLREATSAQKVVTETLEAPAPEAPSPEIAALNGEITKLQSELDFALSYGEKKDQQLAQLLPELERYRKGEPENKLRTVLMDLIGLYDDLQDIIANGGVEDGSSMRRSLAAFESGIIETLRRNEVELYREEGNVYNRETQRPLQNVLAQDPGQDLTIARRVRPGFRLGDRILRHEQVDVFRFPQQQPQ